MLSFNDALAMAERYAGQEPRRVGGEHRTYCPAHETPGASEPSLDIREGKHGEALVQCRSKQCDFPAILAWARELYPKSKLGLVGSSYSASLVLVWGAEHPKSVDALYAFSPGEWIDGWSIAEKTKHLSVPCFFTCGSSGPDTEQAKKLLAKLETRPTVYLPADEGQDGLHGVGTLHMKFDAGRTELWHRLDAALTWLRPSPSSPPSAPTPSPK